MRSNLRLSLVAVSLLSAGCPIDRGVDFWVRGQLVDAETIEPITIDAIGGALITDGVITEEVLPDNGNHILPDGFFELMFSELVGCGWSVAGCPPDESVIPCPDAIELVIIRQECEQTVTVERGDDACSDRELVLTAPIAVPACQ